MPAGPPSGTTGQGSTWWVWTSDGKRHYPYEFVLGDALTYPVEGFDAVHASPPCQPYSMTRTLHDVTAPALIETVRARCRRAGVPYVIENVAGAPLRSPLTLCGTEFGLCTVVAGGQVRWLRRHRLFESNVVLPPTLGCRCATVPTAGVYGHGSNGAAGRGWQCSLAEGRRAMGVGWMSARELAQAIPPAYTEYVGRWILGALHGEGGGPGDVPADGLRPGRWPPS